MNRRPRNTTKLEEKELPTISAGNVASSKEKSKLSPSVVRRIVLCLGATTVLWGMTHVLSDDGVDHSVSSVGVSSTTSSSSWLVVQQQQPDGTTSSSRMMQQVPCKSSSKNKQEEKQTIASSDETCQKLPLIRPACRDDYEVDPKIGKAASPEEIVPPFAIGSYYPDKAPYHIKDDSSNFELIKEYLGGRGDGAKLAFDFGANQGFYAYYLATLGCTVHAFEINPQNFRALQHGHGYNPKQVSERVNLYYAGIGDTNGRYRMQGNNYEGFLVPDSKNGPITGARFDCFVDHVNGYLDIDNVAFVKLDVEGFEIAVLKGGRNSLFQPPSPGSPRRIGAMVMEVGPNRWNRASVSFDEGVEEMAKLAKLFETSYLLARTRGGGRGYARTCPVSLGETALRDKNPRAVRHVQLFRVEPDEWNGLMKLMNEKEYDCNFFYENK